MTIIGIDHIQLAMPVGQEERAIAFYCGLLGMLEVTKPPHLALRGGCWFESAGVKIHLGIDADFVSAKKAHPGLIVDDLKSLCASLQDAGCHVAQDQPLEGFARRYVNDPFGNRIELMQLLSPARSQSPDS